MSFFLSMPRLVTPIDSAGSIVIFGFQGLWEFALLMLGVDAKIIRHANSSGIVFTYSIR